MNFPLFTIAIVSLLIFSPLAAMGSTGQEIDNDGSPPSYAASDELSNGWTHRPIVEHFTGLSCPPCMNGAHPDLTRLWEESGYTDEQPWNYIEWHELNGDGEDDLATQDTYDRMRFYQPEVSGAPGADIDGGYVEAGGSHQTNSCDYDTVKEALEESGNRDSDHMKMVDIEVYNSFDAGTKTYSIDVNVTYLSTTGGIMDDPRLNGRLYVFMLEDHVTAWSKTLDDYAHCHNVFREYAIEDQTFSIIQAGAGDASVADFHAEWVIPETMVTRDDGEIPIKVPVNPLNVYPLAVVYDDDDRSSGTENSNKDGDAHRGSPRALQSATPKTTAYDGGNAKPEISMDLPMLAGNSLVITAAITDDSGEPDNGYLVWRNTQAANNTEEHWNIMEMEKTGDLWEGAIYVDNNTELTYGVMTFDSGGAGSVSELNYYPAVTTSPDREDDEDEFPWVYVGGAGVALLAAVGLVLPMTARRNRKSGEGTGSGVSEAEMVEEEMDVEERYVPDTSGHEKG